EPGARHEVLIVFDRFAIRRPLEERHRATGCRHIRLEADAVLDVAEADRADERKVVDADPEFVKPDDVELVVLEGVDEVVLVVFPELAVELETFAAEELAVLKVADAALRGAGTDALLGTGAGALRRAHRRGLVPPHVIPLDPAAHVQRKILLRRT